MTETKKSPKDTAGMALYLEFRKPDYTYQIIITQPVITANGKPHRSRVMRRGMNAFQSRKNWHFETLGTAMPNITKNIVTQESEFTQQPLDVAKEQTAVILAGIVPTLNQLFHKEYSLHIKPIMVEFTYEDFDTLMAKKTPNSLIRRIQRTRVAQGFGEEIVSKS